MRVNQRGFSFIELVVTVAIMGMLAAAVVPTVELAMRRAKEVELRSALRELRGALDAYKRAGDEGRIERRVDRSGYPANLDMLVEGLVDIKSPTKTRIYFLRRVPRDPFNHDEALSAAQTWGKRSYASPADAPREGLDVFDVFSLSSERGLNGIVYRTW